MKRIFVLILSLSLLFSSVAYADSTSNNEIVEDGSHVLSIYTLNYSNPISATQNEEYVTITIFNKLFEYGSVELNIFEKKEANEYAKEKKDAIFCGVIEKNTINVKLELNKEYIYQIRTYTDVTNYILHYGEISTYASEQESYDTKLLMIDDSQVTSTKSSSVWETENNGTFSTANTIQDDDNVYGYISVAYDKDYYKITFDSKGFANFYLGSIPSGQDYDLYVYDENYNEISRSMNGSNADELIVGESVSADTVYYVKVQGYIDYHDSSDSYLLRVKNYSYTWPTESKRVTYCFACPNYPTHKGIDIGAVTAGVAGDDVYAFADGEVKRYEWSDTYGYCCYINHSNPNPSGEEYLQTRYAHMKQFSVDGVADLVVGNTVQMETLAGLMDNTGDSQGVHLHFETREASSEPTVTNSTSDPIDPLINYFPDIHCEHESKSMAVESKETEHMVSNGILINGIRLIELDHLQNMSSEEFERQGITKEDLNQFINMFELEESYSKTMDILKIKVNQLN
jgi:murein DD-endopeptidase MepM/ murein hydrolase activator NlpD